MTRPRSSWTRRMLTAYLSSPPPPSTHHDPWPPQPGHHDPATHHCRQGGTIRRVEKSNFPSFQVELDEGSMTLDAADWLVSLKHLFIYRSSIPAFPSELNKILSWPIRGQLLTHFNPSFKYLVSIPSRQKLSTISIYQLLLQSLLSFCIHPVDLKECAWKPLWLALDIQMVQTRCDTYHDNNMVITNDILLLWESICKVGIK